MQRRIVISEVTWEGEQDRLLEVRRKVFVEEQGVPGEIEIDEADPRSTHVLACLDDGTPTGGIPIGTARLLPGGRVGRVAVLASFRRSGVGSALMHKVMEIWRSREGKDRPLLLHAQVSSIPFYESLGFSCIGPVFLEAEIPHRTMTRDSNAH